VPGFLVGSPAKWGMHRRQRLILTRGMENNYLLIRPLGSPGPDGSLHLTASMDCSHETRRFLPTSNNFGGVWRHPQTLDQCLCSSGAGTARPDFLCSGGNQQPGEAGSLRLVVCFSVEFHATEHALFWREQYGAKIQIGISITGNRYRNFELEFLYRVTGTELRWNIYTGFKSIFLYCL